MFRGFVFFQAEDGIRDLVRSRGLGDVYKRQGHAAAAHPGAAEAQGNADDHHNKRHTGEGDPTIICLLYTSDAADERSSVDLGGRRIIKKKNKRKQGERQITTDK